MRSRCCAAPGRSSPSICGALSWFWYRTGQIGEGLRWTSRCLAAVRGGRSAELWRAKSRALFGVGGLNYLIGRHAEAVAAMRESRRFAREAGDAEALTTSTTYLAYFLGLAGDLGAGLPLADEAVRLAASRPVPWARAESLMVRGHLSRASGDPRRARAELDEACRLARESGHAWAEISSGWIAGKVSVDLGEPERAMEQLLDVVRLADPRHDLTSLLVVLHTLAGAMARAGRADGTAAVLGLVEAWGEPIGYFPERMDPVDSPTNTAVVRAALPPERFEAQRARGRELTRDGLMRLLEA
ncbi:hypothetical protein [Phytohabitans kaempferiae]|uniref:Anaphase-promoting complex subunit 5 domain-containing protein n=1 Tax=Phytohabitans kaempferiae TaxID=1620943 RepID=A0ABV6MC96_9ACTN